MGAENNTYLPSFSLSLKQDSNRSVPQDFEVHPLIIGQKLATGLATNGAIIEVTSPEDVKTLCGANSDLHVKMKAYFAVRGKTRVSIGVLDDVAEATATTQTITITAEADFSSGTVGVRFQGKRLALQVIASDTVDTIANRLAILINELSTQYTAVASGGVVTATCNNRGVSVGDLSIDINSDVGETMPTGIGAELGTLTMGALDPDPMDVINSIKERYFINIFSPYCTDPTHLANIREKLRYFGSADVMRDMVYISFDKSSTSTNLITRAAYVAEKYIMIYTAKGWRSSIAEIIGVTTRMISTDISKDINIPLQNMEMEGIVKPLDDMGFNFETRNLLAGKGIATLNPDTNEIEASKTTEQVELDNKDVRNVYNLAKLRHTFMTTILGKYSRAKMKRYGEDVDEDQIIMDVSVGESESLTWYRKTILTGQCENMDGFKKNLVVKITDVDTMDFFLPVTLVGQFVVGNGTVSHIL